MVKVALEGVTAYDPLHVQDTVCEGVSSITKIGNHALRFTIYASRDFGDGSPERRVVAQLVWTREDLQLALYQSQMMLDGGYFIDVTSPNSAPH